MSLTSAPLVTFKARKTPAVRLSLDYAVAPSAYQADICRMPCRCGQLGHLTKQCKNEFSRFYGGTAGPGGGFGPDGAVSAVAAAGVLPLAGPAGALPPVAEGGAMPDLSSDLSSGSSSESDSDSEKRKRKVAIRPMLASLCVSLVVQRMPPSQTLPSHVC